MTPEELTQRLRQAMPSGLRAVVLYGSAAAGDHLPGKSDYNVLVVADRLGPAELAALAAPSRAWAKAGYRPPLLFTPAELAGSADSFPIELMDIKQSHRILFGEDPLAGMAVSLDCLRVALERELKAKLLSVREQFLLTGGKPRQVVDLMTASLSGLLVLFRAALRLYQDDVPVQKVEALHALAGRVGFDPQVFLTVQALKEGRTRPREVAADSLFATYLKTVEDIVTAVDRYLHRPS
jgi:hypothetical protein